MKVEVYLTGKEKLLEIANNILKLCDSDQAEVMVSASKGSLTRFANSYIHQNMSVVSANVTIRIIKGQKIGIAAVNSLEENAIKKAIKTATELADLQHDNPDFIGLPSKVQENYEKVESFVFETLECDPQYRTELVKKIVLEADKHQGLTVSGTVSTNTSELVLVNSLGVEAYYPSSDASVIALVMSDTGSGYALDDNKDVRKIDIERVAKIAIKKCIDSQNPITIESGAYDVVLEPLAVDDIFGSFVNIGFNGLAVLEQRSYVNEIGQKILPENITFRDDFSHPLIQSIPFDFEGTPRGKLMLCEKGVVKNLAYDRHIAKKAGAKDNGHALPGRYQHYGAFPSNLILEPGDKTMEELIGMVERGLLITRFHYLNPYMNPKIALMTGMTRDGTFLIENGKITKPVKNLRFTESMLKAFNNVAAMSKEQTALYGSILPALLIRNFNFTGVTEF